MNCTIYFNGNPELDKNIVEILYSNKITLESNNISQYMQNSITFTIEKTQENYLIIKQIVKKINEYIQAQICVDVEYFGTHNGDLNNNFQSNIKSRVNAGTLPLNPQIRDL